MGWPCWQEDALSQSHTSGTVGFPGLHFSMYRGSESQRLLGGKPPVEYEAILRAAKYADTERRGSRMGARPSVHFWGAALMEALERHGRTQQW